MKIGDSKISEESETNIKKYLLRFITVTNYDNKNNDEILNGTIKSIKENGTAFPSYEKINNHLSTDKKLIFTDENVEKILKSAIKRL